MLRWRTLLFGGLFAWWGLSGPISPSRAYVGDAAAPVWIAAYALALATVLAVWSGGPTNAAAGLALLWRRGRFALAAGLALAGGLAALTAWPHGDPRVLGAFAAVGAGAALVVARARPDERGRTVRRLTLVQLLLALAVLAAFVAFGLHPANRFLDTADFVALPFTCAFFLLLGRGAMAVGRPFALADDDAGCVRVGPVGASTRFAHLFVGAHVELRTGLPLLVTLLVLGTASLAFERGRGARPLDPQRPRPRPLAWALLPALLIPLAAFAALHVLPSPAPWADVAPRARVAAVLAAAVVPAWLAALVVASLLDRLAGERPAPWLALAAAAALALLAVPAHVVAFGPAVRAWLAARDATSWWPDLAAAGADLDALQRALAQLAAALAVLVCVRLVLARRRIGMWSGALSTLALLGAFAAAAAQLVPSAGPQGAVCAGLVACAATLALDAMLALSRALRARFRRASPG